MSEHIPKDLGLILATMDDDCAERIAAEQHAETCPACAETLRRGRALFELIDAQAEEVQVDARLKQRILQAVAQAPQRASTPGKALLLVLGLLLSVLLAWFDGRARSGLYPARGHLCLLWELLGATLPLAAAGLYALRRRWRPEPLQLAVIASGGALAAQLWLHWRCPTHDAGLHLLAYHVSGVVLAALLGLAAGQLARRRA
jgi:anti-sigma factor RsiW